MNVEDFSFDLRASLAPPQHLGVGSGSTIVQPLLPSVCGVSHCFSPPLAARVLQLTFKFIAADHPIRDDGNTGKGDCGLLYAGGTWRLDRIERQGTYHRLVNGRLISLAVTSQLVPLVGHAGFVVTLLVRNRGDAAITLDILAEVNPGRPALWPLDKWDFPLPPEGAAAHATGPSQWSNNAVDIHLLQQGAPCLLEAGDEYQWHTAIVLTKAGEKPSAPMNLAALATFTTTTWNHRLSDISKRLPLLESSNAELDAYYRRSLSSGLVCLWERNDFVCKPFVATGGMDGGAICTYPWDVGGYGPNCIVLLLGPACRELTRLMGSFGLEKHGRFSPAGNGLNVAYAYSGWAYISLVWAMACQNGPDPDIFREACRHFLTIERSLELRSNLADFGTQANLLEMRGAGWEHFVASPNSERAWCFDRLADLGDLLSEGEPEAWRRTAGDIRTHVRTELWDAKAGWFRSLYPDGHPELVYSVQAFDALRAGACTPEMTTRMLTHIRDGAFLGNYGVSSISAEDGRHYELNDPDWSGGGAYTGEGPQLAKTLWEIGEAELAWSVLRRHLWMGKHLPYFPQEHHCDRPAVAGHKRANIIGAIAGVEAILFGLIGLSPKPDGSLWILPQPPKGLTLSIRGYEFRGNIVDIHLNPDGGEAVVNGARKNIEIEKWTRLI